MIYLQRLAIRNNKVIQDLTIDFEDLKPMTVFIGENGSGKTTILESLTAIFAALHQGADGQRVTAPGFDFELTYLIKSEYVVEETVVSRDDITNCTEVQVRGEMHQPKSITALVDGDKNRPLTKDLLPNLVIYYPGPSGTLLKGIAQKFEDENKANLRRPVLRSGESRLKELPVFYAEYIHYEMLLATLCSFEYSDDIDNFFAQKLRVRVSDKTTAGIFIKPNQFKKGADWREFWGADGEIRTFLENIRELANTEMIGGNYAHGERIADEALENQIDSQSGLTFIFNKQGWYELRARYGDEKKLFLLLNMLHASDLLAGLWVTMIKLDGNQNAITHHSLSEGERQAVIIKGLTELASSYHTLFLFDEPNVFMHAGWQSDFMESLNEYTNRASFFITTHSPIILSNLRDGHLLRMSSGQAEQITSHYYGREYSDNLEDLMGTSARIPAIAEEIQVLFDLIDADDFEQAETKLNALRDQLGDDDADLVRARAMLNFYQ
jgi:predicted ATPase